MGTLGGSRDGRCRRRRLGVIRRPPPRRDPRRGGPLPDADRPQPDPPAPVRVVCAALIGDGALLATRRAPGQRHAGAWELPGGKVEAGEAEPAALARELEEELGLRAQGLRLEVGARLAESLHAYPQINVLLIAYACRLLRVDGSPAGAHRLDPARLAAHDAAIWVRPPAHLSLAWAPADLPLLPAALARTKEDR